MHYNIVLDEKTEHFYNVITMDDLIKKYSNRIYYYCS